MDQDRDGRAAQDRCDGILAQGVDGHSAISDHVAHLITVGLQLTGQITGHMDAADMHQATVLRFDLAFDQRRQIMHIAIGRHDFSKSGLARIGGRAVADCVDGQVALRASRAPGTHTIAAGENQGLDLGQVNLDPGAKIDVEYGRNNRVNTASPQLCGGAFGTWPAACHQYRHALTSAAAS